MIEKDDIGSPLGLTFGDFEIFLDQDEGHRNTIANSLTVSSVLRESCDENNSSYVRRVCNEVFILMLLVVLNIFLTFFWLVGRFFLFNDCAESTRVLG